MWQPLKPEFDQIRAEQDRAFDRLGGRAPSLDEQREMAEQAARLADLYSDLELAMPEPGPTDSPQSYEVRLLKPLQRFSTFRSSDLAKMARHGALRGVDAAIVQEAAARAADKNQGSFAEPGKLRAIKRGEVTDYYGEPLSWMTSFMSPVRLAVEKFRGR